MADAPADSRRCRKILAYTFLGILYIILLSTVLAFIVGIVISYNDSQKRNQAYSLSCNPRVYVQEFSLPSLLTIHDHNQTSTGLNSSIIIGLEFKRGAAVPGTLATYTDLKMNLYYGEGPSFPVANCTVPHFRMGERRSVSYTAVMEAQGDVFDMVSGGSTVLLRLELIGKFKAMDYRCYLCCCCSSEWSDLQVYAEVKVDSSAHMLSNTPILFT